MANLLETIRMIYGESILSPRIYYYGEGGIETASRIMEIPVGEEHFEMPCFALKSFAEAVSESPSRRLDKIVARLPLLNKNAPYKSLDAALGFCFGSALQNGLFKIEKEGEPSYYAAYGLILDQNFKSIAMYSWGINRELNSSGQFIYAIKDPILRVDPVSFVDKTDSVRRLVTGRLVSLSLSTSFFYHPYYSGLANVIKFPEASRARAAVPISPKVVIEDSPFIIRTVEGPSISTSNESLRKLALNHLDEIV